jgi:hypothetical protein
MDTQERCPLEGGSFEQDSEALELSAACKAGGDLSPTRTGASNSVARDQSARLKGQHDGSIVDRFGKMPVDRGAAQPLVADRLDYFGRRG